MEQNDDAIFIDPVSRRNLEISSSSSGPAGPSLLSVLDRTRTATGTRLLHRWLNRPLRDRAAINRRLDAVGLLLAASLRDPLQEILGGLGDLERILSRVALRSARPRDLTTLRDGLAVLPALREYLVGIEDSQLIQALAEGWQP